jgi:hypothetical protein
MKLILKSYLLTYTTVVESTAETVFTLHNKETSRPHQHRSVQTSQPEQYHQTTEAEETV